MTIEDFLQILTDRDLVPKAIVEQVRAKVAKGDRRITPKSLLKYLVKKEYVTRRQAKQLLETTLTVTPHAESSILGMVPIPKVPPPKKPAKEEIPTITPVDEDQGGLVTDDVPPSTGSGTGADLYGEKPASLVAESLSRIGVTDPTLSEAIEEGKLESDDPVTSKKGRKKRGPKTREWDSSLILLGGGGLVLLILIGVIIGYLLTRENADAVLAEASSFFDGGSYTQAIKQYERFVENHKSHPEYSAAKVKLGLAKLWKASSGTTNFNEALTTAHTVLPEIEDEAEFNTAQRDLASLLPKIAQGLAEQAERADESDKVQTLVEQTNAALALCTNTKYIPKTFRDEVLLNEIAQTLQRVERDRAQQAALALALQEMQTAIESRDTAQAYQIHEKLLDEHPGLIRDEQLAAKIQEISSAESEAVQYVAENKEATTEPRPAQIVAELALAHREGPTVDSATGVVAVRISGAVYGLNVSDGSLQWRHYVGIAPQLSPLQLPDGNVLVVDNQHGELLKYSGQSGKLLWRQEFDSAITRPVPLDDRLLVAENAGKLHVLDIITGQRQGYVQFAQKLSTPPSLGTRGRRIYITGEHSSLYTLSADDFACLGVFFLGHDKGNVQTPPVSVLNKVIVAVAKGRSTSQLEVLNTNADGIPNQRASEQRLSGLVNTALLTSGRRLVALTSRGEVAVYEVGSGTGDDSLTPIAAREPERGRLMARFGLLGEGHVWVAGPKLNKLTILPTSDRLPVSNIDHDYLGDTFDQPLQSVDNLLIHVRRPAGKAGAVVGAMDMETGQAKWETELAALPAGAPAADPIGMQLGVVTASGTAYLVDRDAMKSKIASAAQELDSSAKLPPLDQSLDLGQGRIVASGVASEVLLHFRPGLPRGALRAINLAGPVSCAPVLWGDGFVVPTQTGQVYLYTSEEGEQWGSPFQPPLQPGMKYDWKPPAVYAAGNELQLVLSDGSRKVYLVSRATTPQPHLTATASVDITTAPLNTRFAVVGDSAIAGAEDGSIAVFELPDLASKPAADLGATITWGPYSAADHVVLATAAEELVGLDEQGQVVWRQALAHGPPAGQPVAQDGEAVLLWQQGGLSRLDLASGEEVSFLPLPQPVVAGPVPFGSRLVVSAYDGTLLVVEQP